MTEVFDAARDTRERILNVPGEVAHKLVMQEKPAAITKIVKDALTDALRGLTN